MYNKPDFTYLKANVQQRPPVVATGAFQLGGFDGNDRPDQTPRFLVEAHAQHVGFGQTGRGDKRRRKDIVGHQIPRVPAGVQRQAGGAVVVVAVAVGDKTHGVVVVDAVPLQHEGFLFAHNRTVYTGVVCSTGVQKGRN